MTDRKLYKSNNKKVFGVCAGIAEYLDVDPAIVRIIWAITVLFTGFGLGAYIIAAIIMDENPGYRTDDSNQEYTYSDSSDTVKGFNPER